jgi:glycosyltransferase involved in cell wall biosynthesis
VKKQMTATLSIVLPTYNRAKFLSQAFASIRGQTFTDWELVVVDDGSKDDTRELVEAFAGSVPQTVCYIYQENQGAYAARNTGMERAKGQYVAFFDSDDQWLPHHLQDCVKALDANPEVDWVYGSGRILDHDTRSVLTPNTFYMNGQPKPFMQLSVRRSGDLRIIEDSAAAIECQILHGLFCGLQKSVLRRPLFQTLRFATSYRNEAEDQLYVIRALAGGHRIGYIDNIHLIYFVHNENSSGSSLGMALDKQVQLYKGLVQGYEDLPAQVPLTNTQSRGLKYRLSQEYFWHLGYALLWCNGRRRDALRMYRRGLWLWPFDWRYWKTYLLALARSLVSLDHAPYP